MKFFSIAEIILTISLGIFWVSASFGQNAVIPPYAGDKEDGVSASIDVNEINDLKQYAKRTKYDLEKGLQAIAYADPIDEADLLRVLIENAILSSTPLRSETLMRTALRSARIIDDLMKPVGGLIRGRLLKDSIILAMAVYTNDSNYFNEIAGKLNPKTLQLDYLKDVGLPHASLVLAHIDLIKSVKTRLTILSTEMGFVYNHMNDDISRRRGLAPFLTAIANKDAEVKFLLANNPPKTAEEKLALVNSVESFLSEEIHEITASPAMTLR